MSRRHDLPGGAWIEVRDPTSVTERQRRPLRNLTLGMSPEGKRIFAESARTGQPPAQEDIPGADLERMIDLGATVAAVLIERASFALDGGVTVDTLLDLPGRLFDSVAGVCGDYLPAVLNGIDFDPTTDRSSPTQPSDE